MKKIPTLFERVFENHRVVGISDKAYPGMECVFDGSAIATEKIDGSCCAIIGGEFYKRYDAKKGKKPPAGAIPCCEPDPITGHHPHWVKVSASNPSDKWFWEARKSVGYNLPDATYEAVGPHFQGNPYKLEYDTIIRHGSFLVPLLKHERTFEGIKNYLKENCIEGIVFWYNDEPICKIKRSDFGFKWPKED